MSTRWIRNTAFVGLVGLMVLRLGAGHVRADFSYRWQSNWFNYGFTVNCEPYPGPNEGCPDL